MKMKKVRNNGKSGKISRGEGNVAAWLSLVLFFALAFSILPTASVNISVPDATGSGMEAGPLGPEQLLLSFIENQGQAPDEVKANYLNVTQQVLSNYHFINVYVANDEGVKYDAPDGIAATGGTYEYVPNTYWVMFRQADGGTDPLHISATSNANSAADITRTTDQAGSFWITFSGGQPTMPEGILMLAVIGIIPDNFRVHIRSSGYEFDPGAPGTSNYGLPSEQNYLDGAVDQTFDKRDFIYGPQSWKPCSSAGYPIYGGEDQSDPANQFQIMFIDLNVGALQDSSLTNNGMIKVEYSFENLESLAVFNVYGWYSASYHGTGIIMTNNVATSSYQVIGASAAPVAAFGADLTTGDPIVGSPYQATKKGSYSGVITILTDGAPPVANFTAEPTTGTVPLTVNFTDLSTNTPTSWLWDFGDGNTSAAQNPSHTYTSARTYTVNLTVSNDAGSDSEEKVDYITANVVAPVANFTASTASGVAPLFVRFTDTSANYPISWAWDFGDGGTSTYQNPTHTYMTEGAYTVNLTATNTAGSDNETAIITVTAGSGNGGLANSAWPKFLQNSNNTGQSPYAGPEGGNTIWNYTTGGAIGYAGPSIGGDGTIYFGSYDDKVYALNPDGTQKWNYTTGGDIYGSPAIAPDGTIYIGSYDGKLYALNPDGSQKWNYTTGARIYGSPAIGPDGTVYVGSYDKKFYAINPDGSPLWNYTAGNYFYYSSPAIGSDGTIYIGSYDNRLYALNPNGTQKWNYTTGNRIYGSPAIGSDGTVYVGSYDKNFYAINPNGTLKWSYTTGNYIYGSPAIGADGTIYIGSYDSRLYAFNPDGTLKWSYTAGNRIYGAPAIGAEGCIYVGSYDNKVYAINSDGSRRWNFTTGNYIYGSPAIAADGTLYIGSNDGKLYAFYTEHLAPVANFTSSTATSDPLSPVQFTDTSANYPISWAWDFGDGDTSTEQNPLHTYTAAGTYSVNLTVTNAQGTDTIVKTGYITKVIPAAPVAGFTMEIGTGYYEVPVQFTDESTGVIPVRFWDFGDGTNSTSANPLHKYTPGNYTVTLTVTNSGGSNSSLQTVSTSATYSGLADSPWPKFQGLNNNTGLSSYNATHTGNAIWNFTTGGSIAGCPVIGPDGTVYVGSADTKLYAIYPNGTEKWNYTTGEGISASPAIRADGTIYFGSGSSLFALNPNGTLKWSYLTVGGVSQSPAIGNDGTIYTSGGNRWYALTDTGTAAQVEWNPSAGTSQITSPAIGIDSTIYWSGNYLNAFNRYGSQKWRWNSPAGGTLKTPAVGPDGTIYVTDYGYVTALTDTGTGYISKWRTNTESTIDALTSGIGPDGTIYVGNRGNTFRALTDNGTSSSQKWVFSTGGNARGSPAIGADGTIYFGCDDANVYALNPDGSLLWQSPISGTVQGGLAIGSDGTVYAGTTAGKVYAFKDVAPVADFTASPTSGTAPLTVNFTDLSTNTPTSWLWDFGDGNTSTAQNPSHTYTSVGTYTVNLTVSNDAGSDSEEKVDYINVTEPTGPSGPEPLPSNRHIFIKVANDAGVKYDLDGAVYSEGNNNTHYIKADSGGLNEVHITTDTATVNGQVTDTVTHTTDAAGTFYITNTGPAGLSDDLVILVAVNGTIPDDFSMMIRSSGYNWTPNATVDGPPDDYSHSEGAFEETFTKSDFLYGPQTWKPGPGTLGVPPYLPLYFGQDQNDGQTYQLMFIDLRVGALNPAVFSGLTDGGAAKVEFTFHNLSSRAAFNVYGWRLAAAQGQGISWTNKVSGDGSNGYSVLYTPLTAPVASFTSNVTAGMPPLTVQFYDTSTGDDITAYQWIFSDDPGTIVTEQNPVHTFAGVGLYEVRHAATNAAGTSWSNVTDYINVTSELPPAPVANFTANVTSGTAPLTVQFNDTSTGTPTSWSWTFGDGGTSAEQNPVHTYTTAGTYTVNLTAANAGGSDREEKAAYIDVTAPEPRTWTVGASGCDYTALVDALNNPALYDGDTIYVYNGTYALGTSVTKAITLRGEGTDVVTVTVAGEAISGNGAVVEGLRFSGTTVTLNGPNSIIRDCLFEGLTSIDAIKLSGTSVTLENCTIRNNAIDRPIDLTGSNCIIANSTFSNNGGQATQAVIRMNGCSGAVITRSSFLNNNYAGIGLRALTATDNRVYLNNFVNNGGATPVRLLQGTPAAIAWVSPEPVNYTYQGTEYTNVLGNFWSTYSGTDADGNGVGDSAYSLGVTNQVDDAPLMDLWEAYFTATVAPTANFTANVTEGIVPLTVQFTDNSTGEPTEWAWDFENGNTSTEQNPSHTYTTVGTYTVNLTVTNAAGSDSEVKVGYINVTEPHPGAPVASFTATPLNGPAPLTVQFTDNSTGEPTEWAWDFENDGSIDNTTQNPSYTYLTAGTYSVNLTVTNAYGSASLVKKEFITVTAVLPDYHHIYIHVANDAGVRFDVYGNNTYYHKHDGGGINALHLTTNNAEPYGQVTTTYDQSGVFYVSDTGGRGFDDDAILLLAVNGTIPDNFSIHLKASGYNWTPTPVLNQNPTIDDINYVSGAVDETFTVNDFIYGPQIWRPEGKADYPIYYEQNMSATNNTFSLMFIDLNVGVLGTNSGLTNLTDNGMVKVEYSLENLTTFAAFNAYAWCNQSNQGLGVSWTNRLEFTGSSGYSVNYLPAGIFDTGTGGVPYPSISGTHYGTITPNQTFAVSTLYTYPCPGTGGHTESIELSEDGELIANGSWAGYTGDWHNMTLNNLIGKASYLTLLEGHTYNYTIRTGSYPQIIHEQTYSTSSGWINCTEFLAADGRVYNDWIPAIRVW